MKTAKPRPVEDAHTLEEKIERRKVELIAERQRMLEELLDSHDDLVRELFHLEKFVTLVSYDPKEAKRDQSEVFLQFKSSYDLVSKIATNNGPLGRTRKTRSGLQDRLSQLVSPVCSISNVALIASGSKHLSSRKNAREHTIPLSPLPTRKPSRKPFVTPARNSAKPGTPRIQFRGVKRKILSSCSPVPESEDSEKDMTPSLTSIKELSTHAPKRRKTTHIFATPIKSDRTLRQRSSTTGPRVMATPQASTSVFEEPLPPKSTSGRGGKQKGRQQAPLVEPDALSNAESDSEPSLGPLVEEDFENLPPLPDGFPRILHLYQRPRQFIVTSPEQRPLQHFLPPKPVTLRHKPGQKFKPTMPSRSTSHTLRRSKLGPVISPFYFRPSAFLSSYIALDLKPLNSQGPPPPITSSSKDPNDISITELEKRAESEAIIREKIHSFQKEGRIPRDLSMLPTHASASLVSSMKAPAKGPPAHTTPYSETITELLSHPRDLGSNRVSVTKKIAKAISLHFASSRQFEEKRQKEEVKRLRILARNIGRVVEAEWRKAVWHIRQKLSEKERQEEERLGRMALDQVLEQSGALLGAQRDDITRARLGGGSDDETGEDEAEEAEGREGDEELDEEEDDDDDDGGDSDENEEAFGSHMLLGLAERVTGTPNSDYEGSRVDGQDTTDDEMSEFVGDLSNKEDEDGLESDDTREDVVEDRFPDELVEISNDVENDPSLLVDEDLSELSNDMDLETPVESQTSSQPDEYQSNKHLRGGTGNAAPLGSVEGETPSGPSEPAELSPDLRSGRDGTKESTLPKVRFADDSEVVIPVQGSPKAIEEIGDIVTLEEEESIHESIDVDQAMNDNDVVGGSSSGDASQEGTTCETAVDETDTPLEEGPTQSSEDQPRAANSEKQPMDEPGGNDAGAEQDVVTAEEPEEPEEVDHHTYDDLPPHLRYFAAAVVNYDPNAKITPPLLLRGNLRPYQQSGLEWLATLHMNNLNGILADEMGLGKTIQTIALLAHLACDRGIWGPHLIVVPTSVILNWEMEFKKFLPGFRVLSYHGSTKRRKELRVGWNNRHAFNVCVTSYALASRDAHIFKRKAWYYFVLDEAHMIKNFRSQRWNILLSFRSYRRLLLTGTPLQNNLTELWSLLRFLMSGAEFVELKEFGDWFANPLEKAIENSSTLDDENQERVIKLHTVLRPYILRRLKRDVEKELPNKYEHIVMCPLSKRQRYLYDEFMHRAQTREALNSGVYHQVANILMQLRKVCNHPDLFEVRPIRTSFAMSRAAVADYEIKELLIRRRFLQDRKDFGIINKDLLGLQLDFGSETSGYAQDRISSLDATRFLPDAGPWQGTEPSYDTRSMQYYFKWQAYVQHLRLLDYQRHLRYINQARCKRKSILNLELLRKVWSMGKHNLLPTSAVNFRTVNHLDIVPRVHKLIRSYDERSQQAHDTLRHFAFVTPSVVAVGMPSLGLRGAEDAIRRYNVKRPDFDAILHHAAARLQIAFPDPGLLQYDCGKLQELARLLRERKSGGHRVLIFTQMTRILDILEIFLNFHGWLYLRLDGATKIEDRQYVTERFNADTRIFAFISSSRSGGVGVNLTGADTVVFYDSDFNPQMDRQCEDRAHRIGQIRDVHIYRFISEYSVEEAIFRKANQKRSLDDIVIQKGEFDWRSIFTDTEEGDGLGAGLSKALGVFEEVEDARAAEMAAAEEALVLGEDRIDFEEATSSKRVQDEESGKQRQSVTVPTTMGDGQMEEIPNDGRPDAEQISYAYADEDEVEVGGGIADYMLNFVEVDWDFFATWKI